MTKQAVILAGGKGTRLRSRLGDLPKPLIDVCGVPLLERQILLARRYGIQRILVLVNYRAEQITQFCTARGNWGLDVSCIDDGVPMGTAGAVVGAMEHLEDEFMVMYGDTMLEVDLDRFYDVHRELQETAATLFLHPNDHPHDSDLVELDDQGRIVGFHPYPHEQRRYFPNLVNAALYWVRKSALEAWRSSERAMDFGKDLFPEMIAKGLLLRGYNSPEYIKDCGTPERIDRVCEDFSSGRIERASLNNRQPTVFVDRDGTLNREVSHLSLPEQLELLPGVAEAVRRLNRSEYRVCVVTNQPVIARGECTPQTMRIIHNKLETLLGEHGAYIDRIYYCPHYPDRGFEGEVAALKIKCACRKPGTGMIDAARKELNVDLRRSWLIGDTTSDMLAARRAGVRSVLVETGHAGLDGKFRVTPDYTASDFSSAVEFIVNDYPALSRMLSPLAEVIEAGAVIFVGGQSRAGKSTFSSVLRDLIEAGGRRCIVLSTDRWLLSQEKRQPGVLGRHDMVALIELVQQIAQAECSLTTSLPAYDKLKFAQISEAKTLTLAADDVLIIEGVVALGVAEALDAPYRYFVDIKEGVRRQRLVREYLLRGRSLAEAVGIYEERLGEEYPIIAGYAANAVVYDLSTIIRSGVTES